MNDAELGIYLLIALAIGALALLLAVYFLIFGVVSWGVSRGLAATTKQTVNVKHVFYANLPIWIGVVILHNRIISGLDLDTALKSAMMVLGTSVLNTLSTVLCLRTSDGEKIPALMTFAIFLLLNATALGGVHAVILVFGR